MSKSRGNGVNPDELREKVGADCLRLYICFLGPFEKDKPWSSQGIEGIQRFLERYYRFAKKSKGKSQTLSKNLETLVHQSIKKVEEDIESLSFNTAVSTLMILLNEIYRQKLRDEKLAKTFSQLLQAFAPHLAEEMWEYLGGKGFISLAKWPEYLEEKIQIKTICIGVQVNGKTRGSVELARDESQESALKKALQIKTVQKAIQDRPIKKCIYKQGRILSLII